MTVQSRLADFLAELDAKILGTDLDFYSIKNLIELRSYVQQAAGVSASTSTLDDVITKLTQIAGYVDTLELKADTINLNTDALETQIISVLDALQQVQTYLTGDNKVDIQAITAAIVSLESEVSACVTTVDTILVELGLHTGTLSSISDNIAGSNSLLTSVNSKLDTVNAKLDAVINIIPTLTSSTATIAANNTANSLVAANANRKYLLVQNTSNTDIYLGFSNALTVANGIQLTPFSSLKFTVGDLYTGAIWGIKTAGTGTVSIAQG
jgi:hypothetical protein